MEDSLSNAIAKIRTSSAELNQITDKAAETVRRVEDFLNKECSIGIKTAIEIDSETTGSYGQPEQLVWTTSLVYVRWGDRYRICVSEWYAGDQEDHTKPWSDCTREMKIEAFSHLPALLQAIADSIDKKLNEAEQVSTTVSELLKSLQAKGGGK